MTPTGGNPSPGKVDTLTYTILFVSVEINISALLSRKLGLTHAADGWVDVCLVGSHTKLSPKLAFISNKCDILVLVSGPSGKQPICQCRRYKRFDPWVRKIPCIPWRRGWQPTPVFLLGESHGQESLAGYCPSGHKESDMTKLLNTHSSCLLNSFIFTLISSECR